MGPDAAAPFIVVGLDDSALARAALRWAAREARLIGAVVNAVHVLDADIGIAAFGSPTRVQNDFIAESALAFSYRRGIRRSFEAVHPPPDWRLQFAAGEVGPVLVRAAQGAAMLVIGYRPWRGSDSDLAGPVAHYCLSHLQCPVVALPAGLSGAAMHPEFI